MSGQHHAPAAFTPGKDPVPIVQEAEWAPDPVWIGAENLAPPGFDPRTSKPVASRYTDYSIPAPPNSGKVEINRIRPDRPCSPPNLLHNEHRVTFPKAKRPRRGIDHLPQRLKKEQRTAIPLLHLGLHGLF